MAYCVSQDVVNYCSWPGFAQLDPTAQSGFIQVASDKLDEVARRRWGFTLQSNTDTFDGNNQSTLLLKSRPVVTVDAISVDTWALDNTDGYAWMFNGNTGEVIRGQGLENTRFSKVWPSGFQNIVVQYTGGYSSIPSTLVMATAWAVRYFYDQGMISGAVSEERIGTYLRLVRQLPLTAGLPDHVMGLISGLIQDDAFV